MRRDNILMKRAIDRARARLRARAGDRRGNLSNLFLCRLDNNDFLVFHFVSALGSEKQRKQKGETSGKCQGKKQV